MPKPKRVNQQLTNRKLIRMLGGNRLFVFLLLCAAAVSVAYTFLSLGIFSNVRSQSGNGTVTTIRVTASLSRDSDDAEEILSSGKVDTNGRELHLASYSGAGTLVGLRFGSIPIPKNALIADTYILFHVDEPKNLPATLTIYGEDSDNSPTFKSKLRNISARPKTPGTSWNVTDSWSVGEVVRTAQINDAVARIQARPGWKPGNPMTFLLAGSGERWVQSYRSLVTAAPQLVISYYLPAIPTPVMTHTPAPTPAATATPTLRPTPAPTAPDTGNGTGFIFISGAELASKPTMGAGWDFLKSAADMASYGTVSLSNQDLKTQTYTLAGALVYARTGNTLYRDKVIATVRQACGTEGYSTLALARTLYGYVVAADLVGMDYSTPCTNGQTWSNFLQGIRTKTMGGNSRWYNLEFTSQDSASNWGTYALPTHLAVSYALGDTAAVTRDYNIFKRYLGDTTSSAAAFKPSAGYRYPSSSGITPDSFGVSWDMSQNPASPVNYVVRGINPYSLTDARNGAVIEDALRGDPNSVPCCSVTSFGIGYQAEALDGMFSTAQLFIAHGIDPTVLSDNAMRRAFDFYMRNGGPAPATQSRYLPYFVNYHFSSTYSTAAGDGIHRHMGYGSWLFTR